MTAEADIDSNRPPAAEGSFRRARSSSDGIDSRQLARHYSRFSVTKRVLLTGHSHQAWPDLAFEAQAQAWLDAAELVDDKWDRAFAVADEVRAGYRRLLDDPDGHIALGQNTHELVLRFLSALPLRKRPRLVTTDGEFHSIRRQLDRLAAEGVEIVRIPVDGRASIAARVIEAVDHHTSAVLISSVLFRDARIVEDLDRVAAACERVGAELLVDAYHSLNAVPFSVVDMRLENAFVTGGGYKYCQMGEGNCFLRFPTRCSLQPVITGWFAEFGTLAEAPRGSEVIYGGGHLRFAGSTYDPVSHYRAAAVFGFFDRQRLSTERLREVGLRQIRRLAAGVDELDSDPSLLSRDRSMPLSSRGGFLTLLSPRAGELCRALREQGVHTDFRGSTLRLGPAPYVTDEQLDDAVAVLGECLKGIRCDPAPGKRRAATAR